MRAPLLAVVTLFATNSAAQTVWTVTNGANLPATIAQAAPGDIVLLATGTTLTAAFTLNKGLTLIGVTQTAIGLFSYPGSPVTTINIPPGQRARLVGLDFTGITASHSVRVDGDVAFEHCMFDLGYTVIGQMTAGSNVRLHHCTSRGGWIATPYYSYGAGRMQVYNALVALVDCTLEGSPAWVYPLHPGPFFYNATAGLEAWDSTIVASRCSFTGGSRYYTGPTQGAPGIDARGNTSVFLTDCTLTAGNGTPGGAALAAPTATGFAQYARTTLIGGTTTGNAVAVPELVGIGIDHGLVRGQTSTVTATAGSSQQLLAIVGGFDGTASTNPLVPEPVYGVGAGLSTLVFAIPAPGANVPYSIAVPNVVGLLGVELWFQACQLAGANVRASAVVGGVVR